MDEVLYRNESYEIVGAAIQVWKVLGYGFLEKVYENALIVELEKKGIHSKQQAPITVKYDDQIIGEYVADILVDESILLEIKTGKGIADEHIAQTLNYLKATGIKLGIILNFGPKKMDHKRLVF